MSQKAKQAIVQITRKQVITEVTEANQKFILAFSLIIAYAVVLLLPIIMNQIETLKFIAATFSGPVGTVLGYYFGSNNK